MQSLGEDGERLDPLTQFVAFREFSYILGGSILCVSDTMDRACVPAIQESRSTAPGGRGGGGMGGGREVLPTKTPLAAAEKRGGALLGTYPRAESRR